MAVPLVRALTLAAAAIRTAARSPAVGKAAITAAKKAVQSFSQAKAGAVQIGWRVSGIAATLAAAARKQVNVWRLRRWAKGQGYVRNNGSNIERWDDPVSGEWRLKIKHEGSLRPGLKQGSQVPRADARTGPGEYLNPLTGQTGREAGTHIPLQ